MALNATHTASGTTRPSAPIPSVSAGVWSAYAGGGSRGGGGEPGGRRGRRPAARRVARLPLARDPLVRRALLPVARALGRGLARRAAALDVVGGFPLVTDARHESVLSPAAARTRTRGPRRGAPLERRSHGRWRRRERRRRWRRGGDGDGGGGGGLAAAATGGAAAAAATEGRRRRRTRIRRRHGRRRHGRRTRRARRERRRRGRRAVDVDGVRVGGDAVLDEDDEFDDVRRRGKREQARRDDVRAGGRRRGRAVDANGGRRELDRRAEGERGAVVGDVHVVVEGGGCESRGGDGDGGGTPSRKNSRLESRACDARECRVTVTT